MAIATMVFAIVIGSTEVTAASAGAFLVCFHILFSLFTLLCIAGIIVSLNRGNLRALDPAE